MTNIFRFMIQKIRNIAKLFHIKNMDNSAIEKKIAECDNQITLDQLIKGEY